MKLLPLPSNTTDSTKFMYSNYPKEGVYADVNETSAYVLVVHKPTEASSGSVMIVNKTVVEVIANQLGDSVAVFESNKIEQVSSSISPNDLLKAIAISQDPKLALELLSK